MALMTKASDNSIVLGSAFFTAFVGIFDTENDRIGFAESINTLPGASLTCNKADCTTAVGPNPDSDTDSGNQLPAGETSWILLVVLLVAATLIIFLFVCWYRRKRSSGGESPEVHESSQR